MGDFRLPDLGEGVTEGEIDRWLVKEGDAVSEDDLLVEVITDKATAEIPSPFSGVVTKIHVGEGEVVPVGTVLITIDAPEADEGGDGGIGENAAASRRATAETVPAVTAVAVGAP